MNYFIPDNIVFVLNTLKNSGFQAYIVGGCIRDILLNKIPDDYDITTNALPNQVLNLFEKTVPTGIKHGTVTVIAEKIPIEVTTYRTEGIYTDFRRPDNITFVASLKEDLSRRDFTVNSIAYNPQDGLKDYFYGVSDIKNRILRAVGDPDKRLKEDALRILRLFRFSSVLNFNIDPETYNAAIRNSDLIKNVSVERIFTEIEKALNGIDINALLPLIKSGSLSYLGIYECENLSEISKLPENRYLRFFSFLYLCKCDINKVALNLKSNNKLKKYCEVMSSVISRNVPENKYEIKKMLAIAGLNIFEDYIIFLNTIQKINTHSIKNMLHEILCNEEPYLTAHLELKSGDIIKAGITGIKIGEVKNSLTDKIRMDPQLNTKANLNLLLKEFIGN